MTSLTLLSSVEGQGNALIASSFGLNGPPAGAAAYLAGGSSADQGEGQDTISDRPFDVSCNMPEEEEVNKEHVQRDNPLCAAVLSRKGPFDQNATDLLLVHVQGTGPTCRIGDPFMVEASSAVRIPIMRSNSDTFVGQMVSEDVDYEAVEKFRREVEFSLNDAFGKHIDLNTLDNAFRAMKPLEEKWFIDVTVQEPYRFKKLKKSRVFLHPNGIDAILVFPLDTSKEEVNDVAPIISMSVPARAAQAGGSAAAANCGKD